MSLHPADVVAVAWVVCPHPATTPTTNTSSHRIPIRRQQPTQSSLAGLDGGVLGRADGEKLRPSCHRVRAATSAADTPAG